MPGTESVLFAAHRKVASDRILKLARLVARAQVRCPGTTGLDSAVVCLEDALACQKAQNHEAASARALRGAQHLLGFQADEYMEVTR